MKLKTKKAVSKRIMVSKGGKLQKRRAGQAHFNTKESGKITRNKRRDISIAKADVRNIRAVLPLVRRSSKRNEEQRRPLARRPAQRDRQPSVSPKK